MNRSRTRHWRWLLVILAGVGLIGASGSAWLFGGSRVSCDELSGPDGPELRCAFDVAAPPRRVWEAFTRTGQPHPYYFDAVLQAELAPGGRWRFVTDDLERLLAGGEVLEIRPPRRFVQTFEAADLDDPPSRITVDIQRIAQGCRVTLVHDHFADETVTYRRFRRAHPLALSALKSLLEDGELPLRARLYTAIFKPGMKLFTVHAKPWD